MELGGDDDAATGGTNRWVKNVAATRGVPILPGKVEVASCMERRDTFALAAAMGAHMRPRREEFAPHMAPRRNVAATKGAPVSPGKVEFASCIAPHRNIAVTRDAQIEPLGAEFVAHMVQSVNIAYTRGAPNILNREDFARGITQNLLPLPRAK